MPAEGRHGICFLSKAQAQALHERALSGRRATEHKEDWFSVELSLLHNSAPTPNDRGGTFAKPRHQVQIVQQVVRVPDRVLEPSNCWTSSIFQPV